MKYVLGFVCGVLAVVVALHSGWRPPGLLPDNFFKTERLACYEKHVNGFFDVDKDELRQCLHNVQNREKGVY